jgi:hypothetical protein
MCTWHTPLVGDIDLAEKCLDSLKRKFRNSMRVKRLEGIRSAAAPYYAQLTRGIYFKAMTHRLHAPHARREAAGAYPVSRA